MKILKVAKYIKEIKTRSGGKFLYEYEGLNKIYGRENEHLVLKITSFPMYSLNRC